METTTEQNNESSLTSQPSMLHSRWIAEQVTILAEAFGESITCERLKIYAGDLADIGHGPLENAFMRARQECRFFPKIAELRDFAVGKPEDLAKVEAEAAFEFTLNYLREWGVDLSPRFQGGEWQYAPALPARVEYALRRIGGLRGLNNLTYEARPFAFKEFVEAFKLAPLSEQICPRLHTALPALKSQIKQMSAGGKHATIARPRSVINAKSIPTPLSDTQIRGRRELLKQQASLLRAHQDGISTKGRLRHDQ